MKIKIEKSFFLKKFPSEHHHHVAIVCLFSILFRCCLYHFEIFLIFENRYNHHHHQWMTLNIFFSKGTKINYKRYFDSVFCCCLFVFMINTMTSIIISVFNLEKSYAIIIDGQSNIKNWTLNLFFSTNNATIEKLKKMEINNRTTKKQKRKFLESKSKFCHKVTHWFFFGFKRH